MIDSKDFESFNKIISELAFTVVEHGHLHADQDWFFEDLRSPFNRMYFVFEGDGQINNDYSKLELQGGNVYLAPLGTAFNYSCKSHLHMFYIHFRIELIPGQDLFEYENRCLTRPIELETLDLLLESAMRTQVRDLIRCNAIFYEYGAKFMAMGSESLEEQIHLIGDYSQIYQFVQEHCTAKLKVKDVAAHFGSNMSTFSKKFKAQTGMTLKSYIDSKLIRQVQELLLVTDLSVKDISYKLHFSDEFHFSRYFKRHVGISPTHYRKRSNIYK